MSPGETLLQVDTGFQLPPPRLPRGHAFARRTQPMPKRGLRGRRGVARPERMPIPKRGPLLGFQSSHLVQHAAPLCHTEGRFNKTQISHFNERVLHTGVS